jgi:hypothetical protein
VRKVDGVGARTARFEDRWDMIASGALVRRGLQPTWVRRPHTPQDFFHTQDLPPHLQRL